MITSRGFAPACLRIESVATGSVEDMSEANTMACARLSLVERISIDEKPYSAVPVTTIEMQVPQTAYSMIVPKLAKKFRFRIVKPATQTNG